MLTPEQAKQHLEAHSVPKVQQWQLKNISELPDQPLGEQLAAVPAVHFKDRKLLVGSLREIAYALISFNRDGKPLTSEEDYAGNLPGKMFQASCAALTILPQEDRMVIFGTFFPKIAVHIEQLWQHMIYLPYQLGYVRRAFRAPDHEELFAGTRETMLRALIHSIGQYHEDILWFAQYAPYINRGYQSPLLGGLFAAVIDAGGEIGEAVYQILLASARGEHEIGAMGNHVIRGLLRAARADGWEFIEKLLLAAQREEGLRQSILEAVDEAHPEAFQRMLKVIIEHDLSRFSAVTRAMNVWFGFRWDSESSRVVHQTLGNILTLLESEQARNEALSTGNGENVYLALWAIAFKDVFAAIEAAKPLLHDLSVERRFGAAVLLANLGLAEGNRVLMVGLRDPDMRVAVTAAMCASQAPRGSGVFEEVEALFERMPNTKGDQQLEPIIWAWKVVQYNRMNIAGILFHTLEDRDPKRLIPYMPEFNAYLRYETAKKLMKIGLSDPEVRDVLFKLVSDNYARNEILKFFESQTLQPNESLYVEALLTRKTDDLRRGVLSLLINQPEEAVLASADRLLTRKPEQRVAGLELLHSLVKKDKAVAEARTRALHYEKTQKYISEAEKNIVRAIVDTEETPTLDDALGLMNPLERTPPTPPKKRDVRLASKAALASLYSLDALIHEHRNTALIVRTWQGPNQETLLGNAGSHFPYPILNEPLETDVVRLPMREVWEQWVETRGAELLDDDGLELVRAQAQLHHIESAHTAYWIKSDEDKEEKGKIKFKYQGVLRNLLMWLVRLYPAPNTADFMLDSLETVWAEMPEEKLLSKNARTSWYEDWRSNRSGEVTLLNLALNYRNALGSDWEDRHHVRLWGLQRWMDEPIAGVPRHRPSIEDTMIAYELGAANIHDVYDKVLGPRPEHHGGYQAFETILKLSSKKPHALLEKYPVLNTVFERCRERVLEIELRRGEMPTVATYASTQLRSIPGMAWLLRVLQAMGTQDIERRSAYSRTGALNHLLRVSFPTEQDMVEQFSKAVKKARIPEQLLVDAAVYSPQWAGYIEEALGWKGFSDAVWWLHAHTKDSQWSVEQEIREDWNAAVSERTPLSGRDLLEGAVDVDWFWRIYKALGEKRWLQVYKAAKYSSSGIGHNRAKQFADAMLGKLELDVLSKRITGKRHQDSVRALGLLPLPKKGRDKVILERYLMMQEFLRGSRKFGPQRRESEKLAVQIGMENLARTAGYPDPARLSWAMEAREVQDLKAGAIHSNVDDVTMTLKIDVVGKPQLSIERAGKTIKSLPAKYNKTPEFVTLRERKSQIDRQYSRMRLSLETAMCRADSFTAKELATLLEHPVLTPMLEQLVFVGEGVMGYPVDNGRALIRHDGSTVTLAADVVLRIAHAHDLYQSGEWHLWQRECFLAERIQPFKQVFRELYLLTDAERQEGAISRRYAGHQVQPRQAIALLGARGWIAHQDYGVQKTFHRQNFVAHITFLGGYFTPAEVEGLTMEGVMFSKAGQWGAIQLDEIPPLLFSEVMRDLDLVVSVAHRGGVDPETTASTVEMRGALVRETCALLKIDNVAVQSRHALVEGKLGSYSVHLGSALVHRQPGGSLCIIPVHAQHRGRIFLPFVDDDPKTAEVISKVVLLAKDTEIKDPTILQQIFAKG